MEIDPVTGTDLPATTVWPRPAFPHIKPPPAATKSEQTLEQLAEGGDRLAIGLLLRQQLQPQGQSRRVDDPGGSGPSNLGTQVDEYD